MKTLDGKRKGLSLSFSRDSCNFDGAGTTAGSRELRFAHKKSTLYERARALAGEYGPGNNGKDVRMDGQKIRYICLYVIVLRKSRLSLTYPVFLIESSELVFSKVEFIFGSSDVI